MIFFPLNTGSHSTSFSPSRGTVPSLLQIWGRGWGFPREGRVMPRTVLLVCFWSKIKGRSICVFLTRLLSFQDEWISDWYLWVSNSKDVLEVEAALMARPTPGFATLLTEGRAQVLQALQKVCWPFLTPRAVRCCSPLCASLVFVCLLIFVWDLAWMSLGQKLGSPNKQKPQYFSWVN